MFRLIPALVIACSTPTGASETTKSAGTEPVVATANAASTTGRDLADPVATYGDGKVVSAAQLDNAARAGVMAARQQMYEARVNALEQLILEDLVDTEAKARGLTTPEELLVEEIEAKVGPIGDADIEAFFAENSGRMPGGIDQMRDRIRDHLTNQAHSERMGVYIEELRAKAGVKIFLDPPRFNIEAGDSARHGSADATVQIIEFSDFQCPYCIKAAATIDEVLDKYGDKVSVVYKHFPLSFHDRAHRAAEAAECANEQGKFWAYHDQLFDNQQRLGDTDLFSYAETVGVDVEKFTDCLSTGRMQDRVDADMALGESVGMSGTPGFYINGRMLSGAQPLEAFAEIIDDELGDG